MWIVLWDPVLKFFLLNKVLASHVNSAQDSLKNAQHKHKCRRVCIPTVPTTIQQCLHFGFTSYMNNYQTSSHLDHGDKDCVMHLVKKKKLKRRKKIKKRRLAIWSLARGSTKKKSSPKTLSSEIGQNLPNSSFLEKILLHSMRMKHFSKLDCFWNYLFPLGWSLTWTKKKKPWNSSSICTELKFLVKNLGTQVLETWVPLSFFLFF